MKGGIFVCLVMLYVFLPSIVSSCKASKVTEPTETSTSFTPDTFPVIIKPDTLNVESMFDVVPAKYGDHLYKVFMLNGKPITIEHSEDCPSCNSIFD